MKGLSAVISQRGLIRLLLVLGLTAVLAVPTAAAKNREEIFQIATIDSLMAGLYDGYMSVDQLAKHGDFGLGTFDKLDGEMIMVDNIVYQITPDSVAHKTASSVTTPFAAVTYFDKDITANVSSEMTLPALQEYLDGMLPSKNLFYAIRIDGLFAQVKTRSVAKQNKPYKRLVDVTAQQSVTKFENVRGTLVGFRCPYFVKGTNVPGYHMHFITADRQRGGHLLECTLKTGTIALDTTPGFVMSLPQDQAFYQTDFQSTNQKDLEKVEGK